MGWRGYIHSPRKAVFFWSQKAACTSLFGFLAEDIAGARSDKKFFHTQSEPYAPCLAALRKKGYRSVILARHPVTRCISAYFNKFCVYRNHPLRTRDDLEPFAQNLHDLHCRTTGADPRHNTMSFMQFLDAIETCYAQRVNPEHPINGHWESQVPGFLVARGLYYDDIVHVERLEQDLGALAQRLDMPYRPRQMNRTKLASDSGTGALVDVPACDMAEHAFGYDNFITQQTLARIGRIYAQDFAVLGYPLSPKMDDATLAGLPKARHNWRAWLPYLPR
jgi:hypothetical protein